MYRDDMLLIVSDVNDEHPKNADDPIVVTLFGIVIDVNDEQYQNA